MMKSAKRMRMNSATRLQMPQPHHAMPTLMRVMVMETVMLMRAIFLWARRRSKIAMGVPLKAPSTIVAKKMVMR